MIAEQDSYNMTFSHIEKLLDRRQSTTSFYFSVNTAISAVIGLLIKDSGLTGEWLVASVLILLSAGLLSCWIWRSLLRQYAILLDWWYCQLRELELAMPEASRIATKEYQELYIQAKGKSATAQIGMTKRELNLSWIFSSLYIAFAIGIIIKFWF